MPRTISFPSPSQHVCPVCGAALAGTRCDGCGADFSLADARALWWVDTELHRLAGDRNALVRRLAARQPAMPPGVLTSSPAPAAASDRSRPPVPAGPPVPFGPPAPGGAENIGGLTSAEILVGLGALSLVAAVVVFAAVTWDRLAAWAQGGLLIALTVGVVGIVAACRRKGLVATSEALGAVTVALCLADVHVARTGLSAHASPRTVWSVGLAVVAVGLVSVGRRLGVRVMSGAAAALAFAPLPLAVAGTASPYAFVGALAAQALIATFALSVLDRVPLERGVVFGGGALCWAGTAVGGLGLGLEGLAASPRQEPAGAVAFLALAAAIALLVGRRVWDRTLAGLALALSVPTVLAAVGLAVAATAGPGITVAVVGATGALLALGGVAVASRDPDHPWAAATATAAVSAAALAAVPVVVVATTTAALLGSTSFEPGGAGQHLADRLSGGGFGREVLADGSTLAQLASWALLAVVAVRAGRRPLARALAGALGVAAVVTVPVALDLPVGAAVAALVILGLAGAALIVGRSAAGPVVLVEVALAATVLAVAAASVPLFVAVTVVVVLVASGLAVTTVAVGSPHGSSAVGGAMALTLGGAVLDALVLGADGSQPALVLAVAAALLASLAPVVERLRPERTAAIAGAADAVVVAGLATAALMVVSLDARSAIVALAGAVAALSALRPTRRWCWLGALGCAVATTWMRLAGAEVDVVEAYTLPLAGALLLVGLVDVRLRGRGSWERFGPALVTALAPTTLLVLGEAAAGRTVAVVAAATALAAWGAAGRLQAPLAVGAGALSAVALRHLGPVVVDQVPRYVVFAAAGIVLIAVGATFEQRRQDLRQVRDGFARFG